MRLFFWLGKLSGTSAANVRRSVEVAKDFASNMLSHGLIVIHDALVGSHDNDTELSWGEDSVGELAELFNSDVEARWNDTAFVETTSQVHDDLAGASIIDNLELTDVAVLLHDFEELDEHLGNGSQDNLKNTC